MNAIETSLDRVPVAFPEAALVPMGTYAGKPPVAIRRVITLIGSGLEATMRLRSRSISRRHAVLVNADRGIFIRDLASRTGVIVNDERVRQAVLNNGDRIRVGAVEFQLVTGPIAGDVNGHAAPAARLRLGLDATHAIDPPLFLIGRQHDCNLLLGDEEVARAHAVIFPAGASWLIAHLPARSRTTLNGSDIAIAVLSHGDRIEIAGQPLDFEIVSPVSSLGQPPLPTRRSAVARSNPNTSRPTHCDYEPPTTASPDKSAVRLPGSLAGSSLAGEVLPPAAYAEPSHLTRPVKLASPPPANPPSQTAVWAAPSSPQPQSIPDWVLDAGAIAVAVASSNLPVTRPEPREPPSPSRRPALWWIVGTLLVAAAAMVAGVVAWRW